ncbi:MAG: OmpA family protein [Flavisolibacter sp.]|nr:OmpA family protein [Flavisolibacter sp.]MBD0285400.1 OmpA family protein [Flavisolibacter sp.]MBD0352428.1 OmpA family protein [Flavisolibacter sp.]MBD0375090.1 OmpA family protein [Flavisolibacter sp.]
MKTIKHFSLLLIAFSILISGCSSMNRSQKGAVIGAAGGAAMGGIIGKATGNTAMGVIIGATVGGVAGAVIGKKMDQQAEEMKKVLGDAEVRRVGEGIVVEFKEKVLFGFDQSDLNTSSRTSLDKLTNVLKKYPDTNIEIIGHTDSKGTHEYNQGLSERRASSVASYLKSNGISSSRLKTRGMGETDPKASNDTEAGRAENRRVEFVITANQKMIDDAKRESTGK